MEAGGDRLARGEGLGLCHRSMSNCMSAIFSRSSLAFATISPLSTRSALCRLSLSVRRPTLFAATPSFRASRLQVCTKAMSGPELVSPEEAHSRCTGTGGWKLIDCRTEGEFKEGHPAGSTNLPFMNAGPDGMTPNTSFVDDVLSAAGGSRDAKLLISCQSGKRSAMACAKLAERGFSSLGDVEGGYSAWATAADGSLPVSKS